MLAERVAVLRDGRLVACRLAAELTEAEIVQLMVGRPLRLCSTARRPTLGSVVLEAAASPRRKVHDINFQVRAGEVVGLGGLIGAGRSELAYALFGARPADRRRRHRRGRRAAAAAQPRRRHRRGHRPRARRSARAKRCC